MIEFIVKQCAINPDDKVSQSINNTLICTCIHICICVHVFLVVRQAASRR